MCRVGALGCGYQGSGLVCCPQVGETNKLNHGGAGGKFVDGQRCGISVVQGQDYRGIGAYPWVARVGFKSIRKIIGNAQFLIGSSFRHSNWRNEIPLHWIHPEQ